MLHLYIDHSQGSESTAKSMSFPFLNNVHYKAGFQGLYVQFKTNNNCDLPVLLPGNKKIYVHRCLVDIYFTNVRISYVWLLVTDKYKKTA